MAVTTAAAAAVVVVGKRLTKLQGVSLLCNRAVERTDGRGAFGRLCRPDNRKMGEEGGQ